MKKAVALLISCALHVAVFLSFKVAPAPVRAPETRRVEIELRQVEARRGPPAVENKKRVSKRPPAARKSAPIVSTPIVDEGVPVAPPSGPTGPTDGEEGANGEEGETGGGGGSWSPPPPPLDTRAEVLSLPRVEYPLEAREEGVEGVVRLRVRLDSFGRVLRIEVLEDPGSGLGEAARRAMMKATFRAATHLGANVECSFEYLYRFELE